MPFTLAVTPAPSVAHLNETLHPQRLQQAIERILNSGKITETDRHCLLAIALTDAPIQPRDADLVCQIFDRLRMGLLKVVD
jgi:hypothetical protein